jgi:hypothetical protein
MMGDDLCFLGSSSVAREKCVLGSDEEEPLICHDAFSVGQLAHDLLPGYLEADIFYPNAGLFLEFPDCSLLECLCAFNSTARRNLGRAGAHAALGSIRARHAEDVLADIGEDQIGRDRGGLVEARLAPFALDVVSHGEREPNWTPWFCPIGPAEVLIFARAAIR